MKKVVFFLFVALATAANAQKFEGSFILGLNMSQLDGDLLSGYNKPGIYAGFSTALPLDNTFKITGTMAYCIKGALRKASETINPSTSSYDRFTIHAIDVPITVRAEVNKWMMEMGAGFSVLINSRVDDGLGVYSNRDQLKPVELFFLIGAGYEVQERTTIFGRWSYSLISIAKGQNYNVFQIPLQGLYNNWLTFGAMWNLQKD